MTDHRTDASGGSSGLRDEENAHGFGKGRSTGDQIGGQSSHSEKEQRGEQDWDEQEAVQSASDAGEDLDLDKRMSDDQEQ